MSLILYPKNETAFDSNGIGILSDVIDDEVYEVLNGQFELTVKYPVNGIHFSDIVMDAIITAEPDPVSDHQPFQIYHITKPANGVVTVYARHIAYRNRKITVSPFTASSAPAALQGLKNNSVNACPFEFWTDKDTAADFAVKVPTAIWTLLGNSKGSVLDTYGGEYEFDKFTVKLWNRRGADRGVSIRYGKNLTSLEQDENCANVHTGVYPYWADLDGNLVQLPEKFVTLSGEHDEEQILPLDLSQEFETAPTEEQLRARAEKYIKDNDIGKPDVSWTVEFVQLEQTEEYKGKALLERVLLGDTVSVVFPKLGVDVSARAVAARYKPSLGRYKNITLGKVKSNIADTIVQQGQSIEKKPTVTLMQSIIMTLTSAILGARGGAVRLLDTDGDGMPDTLYVADNADPALAMKVWRWNYAGWAGSKTGYNGPFTLGATLEDGLLAEAVTAAQLVAGTIKSKDGKTFVLDLDNNTLKANFTELAITGKSVEDIAYEKAAVVLNDFADTVTADISNLQSQIDGNITTWFDSYVPTAYNAPANSWTTTALRNQHLGDLFYIVNNATYGGRVYRWMLSGSTYSWQLVEDTEVTKALQQAAEAKDTADGKRRVFISQPKPPYDVGDLWAQGSAGDLMRCITARATGSYVSTDWGLASKYIDATQAGNIAQGKVDDMTFMDIFNKWTNNGQQQGIYSENGVFVINAAVAKFLNLIADHLISISGDSKLEIGAARFLLSHGDVRSIELWNSNGMPIMYMRDPNDIYGGYMEMSPHHFKLGGTSLDPWFGIGVQDGKSEMHVTRINHGKTVIFSDTCSVGSTCEVPGTDYYDLFMVLLGTASGTYMTPVLAYKIEETRGTGRIRGIGGWGGTSSDNKSLYFFTATYVVDTWTIIEAREHEITNGGSIGSGTQLRVKEIRGVI